MGAKAQMNFNDGSFNVGSPRIWSDSARQRVLQAHIASIKVYKYYADSATKKRKYNGHLAQKYRYDQYGNMAEYSELNRRGKMTEHYSYTFNEKNQYIHFTELNSRGRLSFHMDNYYDKNGDCTDIWFFYRSAAPEHKVQRFDNNHNMLEMTYKHDNDKKVSWRFEFSYYDDGSKKQTIEYDRRGKIDHTWNFDCSPVGKLATSKFKDTTKVCIRYEKDKAGNPVKIKESFIKQGNLVRFVDKYDIHDKLLDEAYYDKKGRISSHTTWGYNSKGRMISIIAYQRHSDKIAYQYAYSYGPDNELSEAQYFGKNNKPKYILKYVYTKNS